jgi:two-component system, NtrC family, sensor kinase
MDLFARIITMLETLPASVPLNASFDQTQLLKILWDGFGQGVFILDVVETGEGNEPSFCNVALNSRMEALLSVKAQHWVGKSIVETLPLELSQVSSQHYQACVRSGESLTFETSFTLTHQDLEGMGSHLTSWSQTVVPVCSENGEISQLVVTVADITERVQREVQYRNELRESESKFRQLVEEANDIISTWNLEGTLTYISPSFQHISGRKPEDWLGQSFAPLVHPDDLPMCLAMNQRVAETGEQASGLEFRHQHQDGSWRWMSIHISPMKNAGGNIVGFQGILRDISDRKYQEAQLRQSRQLLQQILDTLPILVFWKDQNLVYQGCNQAALGACGQSSVADLVGKTDYDLPWTKEESDWYRLCDRKVMDSGTPELNIVETQRQANGKTVILNTNKVPLRDVDGTVVGVVITIEDISELKASEAELQEYAERQTLLNQLSSLIRNSLDLDAVIKAAIESIRTMLEIDVCGFAWYKSDGEASTWEMIQEAKADEVKSSLGKFPTTLMGPIEGFLTSQQILRVDNVAEYSEPIHREFLEHVDCKSEVLIPIHTQDNQIGVLVCLHKQQVRPWSEDEIELLQAVTGILAVAIRQAQLYAQSQGKGDALHQALQELQQTQSQMVQREKMSSLGQLVAGIAHEINNPVNFIHGNVTHAEQYVTDLFALIDLYQQECSTPSLAITETIEAIDLDFLRNDLSKLLTSMNVGTERIREIVKSLRIFSRLDESEVKPVDIHDGIDSTLMILQSRLKATPDRVAINIHKAYVSLPEVECFAGQLNQVFMNLLVNAIDALEEVIQSSDSPVDFAPEITIRTEQVQGQALIHFIDNGPGIAPEIQQRIFDPFFTTKPVGKGTGMGMSISYQIVTEKHSGQLLCDSEPGKGTHFIVQIPLKQNVV